MEVRRLIYLTGALVVLVPLVIFISERYFPLISCEDFLAHKEKFSGIVKESSLGVMGSKVVEFENGAIYNIHSFYISDTIKNDQLKLKEWGQKNLTYLLQPGDSVLKTKNSDTIFVYRNKIIYTFINRHSCSDQSK
ncbi:MAG: hypothetical protein ACK5M3_10610 [Dysgonomonas sp.]